METNKNDFDLTVVISGFKQCQEKDPGLVMDHYVSAFTELCRFFKIVGSVFGFVAKDIESKLHILQTHRGAPNTGSNYSTIEGMIEYETKENIIENQKLNPPSGSRTLLRLHRALEFIIQFMDQIATREDTAKTAEIASEVYSATLANYHPWIVRKMAFMAMYTLPNKAQLIELMCKQPREQVVELIHETVSLGQPIFTATQKFYQQRGLLDLP